LSNGGNPGGFAGSIFSGPDSLEENKDDLVILRDAPEKFSDDLFSGGDMASGILCSHFFRPEHPPGCKRDQLPHLEWKTGLGP
jgi:hypothetical protein